jgi:hypothetical protein
MHEMSFFKVGKKWKRTAVSPAINWVLRSLSCSDRKNSRTQSLLFCCLSVIDTDNWGMVRQIPLLYKWRLLRFSYLQYTYRLLLCRGGSGYAWT